MVPMAPSSTRMRSAASRQSVAALSEVTLILDSVSAIGSTLLPLPAGERAGVRGLGCLSIKRSQDLLKDAVDISYHVMIPKSQHEITHRLQYPGPLCILFATLTMLAAIEFHDQFCIGAEE